jgi:hypothetical protein
MSGPNNPSPQDGGARPLLIRTQRGAGSTPPAACHMLAMPFGPQPTTEGEDRMAGFLFRLELEDGTRADPPTFETAVPTWQAGDTVPLGRRVLRVAGVRDDDARPAAGAGR